MSDYSQKDMMIRKQFERDSESDIFKNLPGNDSEENSQSLSSKDKDFEKAMITQSDKNMKKKAIEGSHYPERRLNPQPGISNYNLNSRIDPKSACLLKREKKNISKNSNINKKKMNL